MLEYLNTMREAIVRDDQKSVQDMVKMRNGQNNMGETKQQQQRVKNRLGCGKNIKLLCKARW